MGLPLFMNGKLKYPVGALMFAASYFMYYMTNHNPLFEPKQLPLTWVDQVTPFIPLSVLIYISEYFYFAFVYILLRKSENINKYLYSFFSLQAVSCVIFIIFPTIYPRENFPVPEDTPQWLAAIWHWLRNQDAATNCFPSLHVSSVFLSAFVFWDDDQKNRFYQFMVWSIFIALSTLTTKQHFVADLISGLTLALFFFWLFHRKVQYYWAELPDILRY